MVGCCMLCDFVVALVATGRSTADFVVHGVHRLQRTVVFDNFFDFCCSTPKTTLRQRRYCHQLDSESRATARGGLSSNSSWC